MKRGFILLLAAALAACSTYQAPNATDPQATVNIDGEATLTAATNWWVYDNPCQQKSANSGQLTITTNIGGRHKQAAIRAGAPVYLVVNTHVSQGVVSTGTGRAVRIGTCATAVRFTPESGKAYDAQLAPDECRVALVEHATGTPPAGAQAFALRGAQAGVCVQAEDAIALAPPVHRAAAPVPALDEPVPYLPAKGQERFRTFLTKPLPRAFAISQNGYSVSVSGTQPEDKRYPADPVQRALQMCKEYAGRECELYMVDDRIVFHR
ncbi:hypothetical protein IP92_04444 [Pseudoduganella flava]|uniref:DUF4189 domain-containing protein n=1 Tax=Pseudoduganella flava TaxID=871742 RepID=A0A562PJ82_9BURK|nr:hypothetical protein [Pseudoduganella flava]QGZ42065.1 hypothetical protein GO485_25480 [Pseudoduganella flava]TWI44494.1 hypothetical protein IP92_04444 [Pseudoduganella flava]